MLICKVEKEDRGFKMILKKTNKNVLFKRRDAKDDFLTPDVSLTEAEENYLLETFKMNGRKMERVKIKKQKEEDKDA